MTLFGVHHHHLISLKTLTTIDQKSYKYYFPVKHKNPIQSSIHISFPSISCNYHFHFLTKPIPPKSSKLHSLHNSSQKPSNNNKFSPEVILLFIYFITFLSLRLLSSILPSDFSNRWNNLIAFSEEAEIRVCDKYPSHLWQAIVASEDRRFFRHCGVDFIGIARAVSSWSSKGGGSTITQQLVKNTLLKNERTLSRKAVEMVLAILLERRISKWSVLASYMSKIYWGHGIYGIESASYFYFGKHPSLLSLGESAMLAGIIPAPESRSPLRDMNRGKTFQVRALRRMVEVGFLDIQSALVIVEEPLHLSIGAPQNSNELCLSKKELENSGKQGGSSSTNPTIWDWERESCMWELREYMERWALRIEKRKKGFGEEMSVIFFCKGKLNSLLLAAIFLEIFSNGKTISWNPRQPQPTIAN
ncbi:hypothetical protein MKW98_012068 [Papaver atlanticum]|uniref:Glycosyl transferase family 51 domain-containing protein n=1 Tax=Papaver atlanticum TaxID=357466 RepID=A0AAD4SM24_9MAGN|nr:hypothetical protein MKW98_012068 [Papaver atlanticum]